MSAPLVSPPHSAVHRHLLRVYYEDTDAGGVVYHASHLKFFERGRTELLRALGIDQSVLAAAPEAERLIFVVRRMTIDYLRPGRLDDLLAVDTRTLAISGPRITLDQSLLRLSGAAGDAAEAEPVLLARAEVLVVAIGADFRPRKVPDAIAALLGPAG
ncbi:YbgC/FadM family acyl-CoA thioesterase [Methylobrevis albus]|uniref:YbgC/FadM family acyl-CoA thioesterase n=1 Tax=Methylobrevis albus TaxID=2793297 RepID=A0A931I346_9HYPH|nr:YbgC/FadM family acyl-CoA thioesterase [Methylobrevis albus]MBH0239372.1 YbgC/FadM family acyl-CoA thioesterase [Methylobrevis albus]